MVFKSGIIPESPGDCFKNRFLSLTSKILNHNLENGDEESIPIKKMFLGFPGGSVVKNIPANARDMGLIPDLGGSHMLQSN